MQKFEIPILVVGDQAEKCCDWLSRGDRRGRHSVMKGVSNCYQLLLTSKFWVSVTFATMESFLLDPFVVTTTTSKYEQIILTYTHGDESSLDRATHLLNRLVMSKKQSSSIHNNNFNSNIEYGGGSSDILELIIARPRPEPKATGLLLAVVDPSTPHENKACKLTSEKAAESMNGFVGKTLGLQDNDDSIRTVFDHILRQYNDNNAYKKNVFSESDFSLMLKSLRQPERFSLNPY